MLTLAHAASRENPVQIGDSFGDACRHCGSTLIIIAPPSLSLAPFHSPTRCAVGARRSQGADMHAHSKDPARLAGLSAPPSYAAAKAAFFAAAEWLHSTWFGKAVATIVTEHKARIAIEELRSWDNHMLRDIGLERMDIDLAVRGQLRPLTYEAEPAKQPPHPHDA